MHVAQFPPRKFVDQLTNPGLTIPGTHEKVSLQKYLCLVYGGSDNAGLMLSAQYFEGADMVSALEEQIVMVRLARDRGWDSYFSGQHYLNEGGNQGLQMVPYLARLAADAGDMTLGVGVLILTLHPLTFADAEGIKFGGPVS